MSYFLFTLLFLLSGCAHKSLYYWGNYQDTLYLSSVKNESPNKQIDYLLEDVQGANKEKKPLPPGFFAQLGLLYTKVGSTQLANEAFSKERNMYKDSHVMMDRFLKNQKR